MKVIALKNVLYRGKIYREGEIFDMDDVSAAIAEKYKSIRKIPLEDKAKKK